MGCIAKTGDIVYVEAEGGFGVRPYAANPDLIEALWTESVRLTGIDVQG